MASIDDVFNEIQEVNTRLQQLHGDVVDLTTSTNAVKTSVDQVDNTLNKGFANLSQGIQNMITLQDFANQALAHNSEQNATIICILEYISEQTCKLLNEAHTQTGLQTSIKENVGTLMELYKSTNPEAALEFERLEKLRKQILECCPPEKPEPFCRYEPCAAPEELGERPRPEYEVFEPTSHQ